MKKKDKERERKIKIGGKHGKAKKKEFRNKRIRGLEGVRKQK